MANGIYQVYYSRMKATPRDVIERELAILGKEFGSSNVHMHDEMRPYDPQALFEADLVFVTGYNKYHKGKGTCAEIGMCHNVGKPVYLLGSMQGRRAVPIMAVEIVNENEWTQNYCVLTVDSTEWHDTGYFNPKHRTPKEENDLGAYANEPDEVNPIGDFLIPEDEDEYCESKAEYQQRLAKERLKKKRDARKKESSPLNKFY